MVVLQGLAEGRVFGDEEVVVLGPYRLQIQQLAHMAAARRGQAKAQAPPLFRGLDRVLVA